MKNRAEFNPLYQQVYSVLVQRISEGVFKPGSSLPSEPALARELNVSPGTVRKALDAMTNEGLVERRQGKGTYVTQQTADRAMFRFFRLARADGVRVTPSLIKEKTHVRTAKKIEQQKLGLEMDAQVCQIERVRRIDDRPAILEAIVVPASIFPGIEERSPLPNALYPMFQKDFGIFVVEAEEQITADRATARDARNLGVETDAPILKVERIATALGGKTVEYRVSRINTSRINYSISLK